MSVPMRKEDLERYAPVPTPTPAEPPLRVEHTRRRPRPSLRRRLRAALGIGVFSALCGLTIFGAGAAVNALRPAPGLHLISSPEAGAKAVLDSASVERKLGFVTVSGTVLSHAGKSMPRVEAVVELLDAQNRTVQVESGMVAFDPLPSGQAAPFRVDVTDVPQAVGYRVRFRQADGFCLN